MEETATPRILRHLHYDERCQIHDLHQWGTSVSAIAALLQCHKSTVSRELRRNTGPSAYHHLQAQQLAQGRRHQAGSDATGATSRSPVD